VPQWGQPMQSGVMMPPGYVYQYPPQHQYPPQFQPPHQHPHPMHGALVPQWGQPMQSAVMMPAECAPQLQRKSLDLLKHLIVYVWRGAIPNFDLGEPDYVAYAYAKKKVKIADELPKMLDRIGLRMKKVFADVYAKYDKKFACEHNVRVRLDQIKWFINNRPMTDHQKAITFAWAFLMERQGAKAFYALGFLRDGIHNIHYLWISWRLELPNYLYALAECTDIEGYGSPIRSSCTYRRHQKAYKNRWINIPTDLDRYSDKWEQVMDLENYGPESMRSLFYCIFPKGDARDAKWLPLSQRKTCISA